MYPFGATAARTAFAFRGYNNTNLGRSAELLAHPVYGSRVAAALRSASELCADASGRYVDLADHVRAGAPATLGSFPQDVAMIVAMELAQLDLLERYHEVNPRQAGLCLGYSIGELAAVAAAGVFRVEDILPVPLALADDCATLAEDVTMGVVFNRGGELSLDDVRRLCVAISAQGKGMIGVSARLGPNAILVLGEGATIAEFQRRMRTELPGRVTLRRNEHQWPPLHTPLVWRKNIPSRAAMAMNALPGGLTAPNPPIVSCVTGRCSYNDFNAREHLHRWTDHPQLLFDAMETVLAAGVEVIVHLGPEPNLIPATFGRLAVNVEQTAAGWMGRLGREWLAGMARRPWLAAMLPARAALLRAPNVRHIVLEDWLLEHEPATAGANLHVATA